MATAAAAAARRLPLLLGASSTLLYLLFPFVGDRGWDALMTASVLARPEGAGAVEILFFAHPLVIPLTWPFAWLTDPLLATSLRESVAAGVVVGLSARLLLGLGASRLGAMLGALLLTFASGRWVLATSGEEKETAMAFGGLFVLLYLDHRGWLEPADAERPGTEPASPERPDPERPDPERPDSERSDPEPLARQGTRLRASLLGGLLALCVGVHLIGIALFSLILVDLGLGLRGSRGIPGRRRIAEALLPILLVGGTLSLVGLGWLALGPGGARTLPEALDHFLEYHRTGEFGPRESGLGGRLLEAYGGLRAWLLAEAGGWPWLELPIVLGLLVAGISGALRRHPGASRLLLAWLLLLLAHLLFFAPWDPESWATLSLPLVVLLTLGLDARVRERPRAPRRALALLALGALALLGAHDLRLGLEARDRAAEVYGGIAHPAPMASIARALDRRLERDALLLVEERLDASYLQIFTDRDPIIPNLVGLEARALREERLFSVLSLRYYQQRLGPAQLLERLRLRPTYWLGARLPSELRSVETIELGWGGLSLHRLDPSEAPSARALRLGRSLDASR